VRTAPSFPELAPELARFIGDCPVVGQNVAFDLNFLGKAGLRLPGPVYDTFELGSMLLPGLSEHSLRTMAGQLGVPFPVQHRALPDAEAAMSVFLALRERLFALSADLLAELARLAKASGWQLSVLFQEALAGAGRWQGGPLGQPARLPVEEALEPLSPAHEVVRVDGPEALAVLGHAADPSVFPDYEERPE